MSMHITYLKDHDGHKACKNYFVERTLACRLCENGIALPHILYLESIKKATEVALKEKIAEEKKKADLIKNRETKTEKPEMAVSTKAQKREKTKVKPDKNYKK